MSMFALVDCNNFYASCERLFKPRLMGRPVVVLSNNDGCIIARSNEAKGLGIAMGAPYFKYEKFLQSQGVAVFSSNYALYGDISSRVMALLKQLEPEVEVYSIDEAFLHVTAIAGMTLTEYGGQMKETVRRWTGIPVSIGIGSTKTLAKVAGRFAKKDEALQGVFDLTGADVDAILGAFAVDEVWGIGCRLGERLARRGITTALALKNCDDDWLRKNLSITGLRTAMELRGIPCLELEDCPVSKKSIASSKSFGRPVELLAELKEALATYIEQAAVKLRAQHAMANSLEIALTTNRFSRTGTHYSGRKVITLAEPTASSSVLIQHALPALAGLYKPGLRYQKVGVVLFGLVPESYYQPNLFFRRDGRSKPLMAALDRINSKWGRCTIQHGAAGLTKPWQNRQLKKSPAFTTSWQELPVVKASGPSGRG
ncbi:MAG: Y-family DNA polymerase [Deltaproteobacteria bacterium]|nr:Y-family DNA polymerase [Deltaproteobacteria bacterium]